MSVFPSSLKLHILSSMCTLNSKHLYSVYFSRGKERHCIIGCWHKWGKDWVRLHWLMGTGRQLRVGRLPEAEAGSSPHHTVARPRGLPRSPCRLTYTLSLIHSSQPPYCITFYPMFVLLLLLDHWIDNSDNNHELTGYMKQTLEPIKIFINILFISNSSWIRNPDVSFVTHIESYVDAHLTHQEIYKFE